MIVSQGCVLGVVLELLTCDRPLKGIISDEIIFQIFTTKEVGVGAIESCEWDVNATYLGRVVRAHCTSLRLVVRTHRTSPWQIP